MGNKANMILAKAAEILENQPRGVRFVLARNNRGDQVSIASDKATCFCTLGAIDRAEFELGIRSKTAKITALNRIQKIIDYIYIGAFNDRPDVRKQDMVGVLTLAQIVNTSKMKEPQ